MHHLNTSPPALRRKLLQHIVLASGGLLLAGCGGLRATAQPSPAYYTLDWPDTDSAPAPAPAGPDAPTLLILPPRAAAGFDGQRIIYLRERHRLEYFARSEWVDPPARMLGPLLVRSLQRSGAYRAVMLAPTVSRGTLQLETQLLMLQHEFLSRPSQVRLRLRATLSESRNHTVLASRDFEAVVTATEDTPYGGVRAANLAVQALLSQVGAFCQESLPGAPPMKW